MFCLQETIYNSNSRFWNTSNMTWCHWQSFLISPHFMRILRQSPSPFCVFMQSYFLIATPMLNHVIICLLWNSIDNKRRRPEHSGCHVTPSWKLVWRVAPCRDRHAAIARLANFPNCQHVHIIATTSSEKHAWRQQNRRLWYKPFYFAKYTNNFTDSMRLKYIKTRCWLIFSDVVRLILTW